MEHCANKDPCFPGRVHRPNRFQLVDLTKCAMRKMNYGARHGTVLSGMLRTEYLGHDRKLYSTGASDRVRRTGYILGMTMSSIRYLYAGTQVLPIRYRVRYQVTSEPNNKRSAYQTVKRSSGSHRWWTCPPEPARDCLVVAGCKCQDTRTLHWLGGSAISAQRLSLPHDRSP